MITPGLAVSILEPVKFPPMIEWLRFGPNPLQYLYVLASAPVAGVVVQPVAVALLLLVAASGNDVKRGGPESADLGCGFAGRQGRHDEAGPVGDEVP